jgi:hypothetical protein
MLQRVDEVCWCMAKSVGKKTALGAICLNPRASGLN